jgi:phenylacetate-CoA ligase
MRLDEWFSRSIGFPLVVNAGWRRSKDRRQFGRVLREKLDSQYWPAERLEAIQLQKLKALLEYAGDKAPYYRDLFREQGFDPRAVRSLADLKALPPLNRKTVQTQAHRLRAEGADRRFDGYTFTGGSTGVPLQIWQDRAFNLHAEAGAWLGDITAGRRFGSRTVYFWAGPRDPTDYTGWRGLARTWLRNEVMVDTHSASEAQLAAFHRAMQARPPDILVSYASTVTSLALYLERQGQRPNYPRAAIIPSGELLEPGMRAVLERVFPAPVFNRYGSREVGLIAYECEQHQGLHLNQSNLILECAGPDPYAEPGEVLVTQLYNRAMPLIRYELEDLAVLASEPCPCGRTTPRLRRVAGRRASTFLTADGRLIEPYYLVVPIRLVPGVLEFQLVQEAINRLRLMVVAGPDGALEHFAPVRADLAAIFGAECELDIEFVDRIPLPPSGKPQMVVSRVSGHVRAGVQA